MDLERQLGRRIFESESSNYSGWTWGGLIKYVLDTPDRAMGWGITKIASLVKNSSPPDITPYEIASYGILDLAALYTMTPIRIIASIPAMVKSTPPFRFAAEQMTGDYSYLRPVKKKVNKILIKTKEYEQLYSTIPQLQEANNLLDQIRNATDDSEESELRQKLSDLDHLKKRNTLVSQINDLSAYNNETYSLFTETFQEQKAQLVIELHSTRIIDTSTYETITSNFKSETQKLRERIAKGEDITVDALALATAASRFLIVSGATYDDEGAITPWLLDPFNCQLQASVALQDQVITEMATGEGKTLVAVLTSYVKSLEGKGVHITTSNDTLVKRDAAFARTLLEDVLGVTVGEIIHKETQTEAEVSALRNEKQKQYAKDVTYSTLDEITFDFLRDNCRKITETPVLRPLHSILVDEADHILINQAINPHILGICVADSANPDDDDTEYIDARDVAKELQEHTDFEMNHADKTVGLTKQGAEKARSLLQHLRSETIPVLASSNDPGWNHLVCTALKVQYLYEKDKQYTLVNEDGESKVIILDESTGHQQKGSVWRDGIHQAVEAHQNLEVTPQQTTIGRTTTQSFAAMYNRRSGMTGTAMQAQWEFKKVYEMDVLKISRNKKNIRVDSMIEVYLTKQAKYEAICDEICVMIDKDRPVLVGVRHPTEAENLKQMLHERYMKMSDDEKVKYKVLENTEILTGKPEHIADENSKIRQAGKSGSVLIASPVAGRGTDIKLDKKARAAGGLHVIVAEINKKSVDLQYQGRSGRKGDPGSSSRYASLDDEILRKQLTKADMDWLRSQVLSGVLGTLKIENLIEASQKKMEFGEFQSRKTSWEFDEILTRQMLLIRALRDSVADGSIPLTPQEKTSQSSSNSIFSYAINGIKAASNYLRGKKKTGPLKDLTIPQLSTLDSGDFIGDIISSYVISQLETFDPPAADFTDSLRKWDQGTDTKSLSERCDEISEWLDELKFKYDKTTITQLIESDKSRLLFENKSLNNYLIDLITDFIKDRRKRLTPEPVIKAMSHWWSDHLESIDTISKNYEVLGIGQQWGLQTKDPKRVLAENTHKQFQELNQDFCLDIVKYLVLQL